MVDNDTAHVVRTRGNSVPAVGGRAVSSGGYPVNVRFAKMHGAGNDFVVIDGVRQSLSLRAA